MIHLRSTIITIILLVSIGVTKAGTLDQTAFKILTGSPEYKAELYSLESTLKSLSTESNLPDPELGGEYLVTPADVENRWTAEISWGIEWPGVYGARGKEAKSKMLASQYTMDAIRAERLAEIKDFLLDYVRCRQKIILLQELSQNNDTIYRLAEQAARGGEMTLLDLNKVKLEYANIRVAMASLLDEEAEVIGNLSRIYGSDCRQILNEMDNKFPEILLPSPAEISNIKDTAPAVKVAREQAQTARLGKKVAKMEALPSISVGYKHQYEDFMHLNGATLGLSLPLFSSRGKQKAADAQILEADFNVEYTALEIESEAMATYRRLQMMVEQIKEIAPIVENVDYNDTLLKAYKGGVITLIEYISDRNYFTNAAIELVTLRHNAAKALAFLQRYTSAF